MVYKDRPAIRQETVIHAQWSDMPEEVVEDVRRMWRNAELGNDFYYIEWDEDDFYTADDEEEDEQYRYPILAKYLRDNGIKNCLIHYWW